MIPRLLPLLVPACALAGDDIRDIRGPLIRDVLPPFTFTLTLLLLALILFGMLRLLRRRTTPSLPGVEAALPGEGLAGLVNAYRCGACSGVCLILQLDGLVRAAFHNSMHIPAHALTSDELRRKVATPDEKSVRVHHLDVFLPLIDRVKYAGYQPSRQEIELALGAAVSLIDASGVAGTR